MKKAVLPDFALVLCAENSLNALHVVLAGSGPSSKKFILLIVFSLTYSVPKFS